MGPEWVVWVQRASELHPPPTPAPAGASGPAPLGMDLSSSKRAGYGTLVLPTRYTHPATHPACIPTLYTHPHRTVH